MRGDQLPGQWQITRAIEASPIGLTLTGIAQWEQTGIRTIYRDLEASQATGFTPHNERNERTNHWAFIDAFRFKIPPRFILTELMSLDFYKDLVWVLKSTPFYNSLDLGFKKVQSTLSPQALSNLNQIQSVFHLGIKPYKDYAEFRGNGYNGASF